jgi:hypothetical protein
MKKCTTCHVDKTEEEFNKNKIKFDGLNNICRDCSNERSKKYYQDNKEKHKKVIYERNKRAILVNRQKIFDYYKLNPCIDCGETDPIVLEFDHKDDVDKKDNVSNLVSNGSSWKMIEKEIEKCDVRCANCHRKRTAIQFGWYKGINF